MADQAGVDSAADTLRAAGSRREAVAGAARRETAKHAFYALLYALAWSGSASLSGAFWFLPAGLRFLALWLAPTRQWGWFAAADVGAILVLSRFGPGHAHWLGFVLATFLPWIVCALAVSLARPGRIYAAPESPARMGALIAAMLLAATVNASVLAARDVIESRVASGLWLTQAFDYLVRDYLGMLILVPIGLQLLPRNAQPAARALLRELGLVFLPLLLLFWLLLQLRTSAAMYAGVLALVPMMLLAFRQGWRGASWALALTGAGFFVVRMRNEFPLPLEMLRLFLVVVGSVALLLGAAIESLRRVNVALIERNRHEQEAGARVAAQASDLRELSRRLVRAQEDEQRRLAHELHDELGQWVAALGTRLGLLARKVEDRETVGELNAQRELVQRIQESIREVLQGLRPAVLDRFGLAAALREGPIRRLIEGADVQFDCRITGPVERVGADTGSAIYRICQEAATNCVKHAQARHFRLQLDVAPAWADGVEVHLRIEDDGKGFDLGRVEQASGGSGLRGIRDRVMALAGEYRCETGPDGTRHLVWFVEFGRRR
jgi:glucose-6-phosphate-specific signal transduction histidine kinase